LIEAVEHARTYNERREVGNGRHDTLDKLPGEIAAMDCVSLLDDGANTTSADEGPDHESNAADRDEVRLDGEEMTDLVDREPNGRQGAEPEDEEGNPVSRCCSLTVESAGVDLIAVPGLPDGTDHDVHAVTADVSLDTVPNTRCSLELALFLGYCSSSSGTMTYPWQSG
jgi:hypothetical protein